MKKVLGVACGLLLCATTLAGFAQSDREKLSDRLTAAQDVMNEIMATPDRGIPRGILGGAKCVTIIPAYKKGAFVVGAQYGQGVATCRTPNGWSAPVFVRLEGGSFGWQIGGQSTDLVLIAMNEHGLQDMLKNKVKLGADAAASAGPVGRRPAPTGSSTPSSSPTRAPRDSSPALISMAPSSPRTQTTPAPSTAPTFPSTSSSKATCPYLTTPSPSCALCATTSST